MLLLNQLYCWYSPVFFMHFSLHFSLSYSLAPSSLNILSPLSPFFFGRNKAQKTIVSKESKKGERGRKKSRISWYSSLVAQPSLHRKDWKTCIRVACLSLYDLTSFYSFVNHPNSFIRSILHAFITWSSVVQTCNSSKLLCLSSSNETKWNRILWTNHASSFLVPFTSQVCAKNTKKEGKRRWNVLFKWSQFSKMLDFSWNVVS